MAEEIVSTETAGQPSRPAITEGDKTDLLTTQTEKPDQLTPSSAQGKKTTERLKGPQCYHCHEWGNIAAKCPKKVLEVNEKNKNLIKREAELPYLVSGLIEGKTPTCSLGEICPSSMMF